MNCNLIFVYIYFSPEEERELYPVCLHSSYPICLHYLKSKYFKNFKIVKENFENFDFMKFVKN